MNSVQTRQSKVCRQTMAERNQTKQIALLDHCIEIQKHLFGAQSLEGLLQLTESLFEDILPLQYTGLYLYNETAQKLELKIAHGFSEEERRVAENTALERHPGKVYFSGKAIYVPDTEHDKSNITIDSTRSFVVRCRLYQPITVQGKCIGVFGVVSGKPNAFSDLDKKVFEFVCQVFGKAYLNLMQVNEIKKTNEQLNLLSFLATHTDNAVIVTDEHGRTQWVNDEFTKISGYSLHEIEGKKPGEILQGKRSDPTVAKLIGEAIKSKKVIHTQIVNYTKNGDEYINELSIYPFKKNGNEVSNYIALQRDITERVSNTLKIEQQGRQLDAIFQSMPDIVLILSAYGRIEEVLVNEEHPRRANLLKLKDKAIHELVLQEDLAGTLMARLQKTIHEKTLQTLEFGEDWFESDKVFEARLAPLDDHRALCLLRNITEEFNIRKERERIQRFNQTLSELSIQLLFSEVSQFEAVIESMLREIGDYFEIDRTYLFEFNETGDFLSNTHEWCKAGIASVKPHLQEIPTTFSNWWVSKLKKNETVYISNVAAMPDRLSAEKKMLIDQGVQSLLNLPLKVNGKIIGFFGCDAVITRKLWSELEISQIQLAGEILSNTFSRRQWIIERDRFRSVFENSVFGALIINSDNKVVYQNQFLRNLHQHNINPKEKNALSSILVDATLDHEPLSYALLSQWPSRSAFEVKIFGNSENEQILLCNSVMLPDELSKAPLIALTFIDITDRILQEQEAQQALTIVSEQNKKLLNFSYIVSHNIRSHASTISGFIHLLDEENDESERNELIQGLAKSSKSLDGTLRHLSELLNIQSRVGIHKISINLFDAIEKAISAIAIDLNNISHTLNIDVAKDFYVSTDPSYLDSILLNLISNAVKYRSPERELRLEIKAWKNSQRNYLSVTDNGKGIDLERHGEKLFGMFKTFHGNSDARGIGLFITRNQIEALGGQIEVQSTPNLGTSFLISLP